MVLECFAVVQPRGPRAVLAICHGDVQGKNAFGCVNACVPVMEAFCVLRFVDGKRGGRR